MTDDGKPDPDKKDDEGHVKFGDLRAVVKEVVTEVVGSFKGDGDKKDPEKQNEKPVTTPGSIKSEVQAALAEIRKGESEAEQTATTEGRIKALEDKTAEKAPVERRRVHRIMGWGE